MQNIPLIILVGPTGVGKSHLAQQLALQLNTAIVHADSRQVYRRMDIGTAKPDRSMREVVPHYLLDVVDPDESFNAGRYRELAAEIINQLWEKERKPIIVEGGTGLYIRVLIDGLFDGPKADKQIRENLQALATRQGTAYLHQQLQQADPISAGRIHPNDQVRIARALEIYQTTGKPLSEWQQNTAPSPYQPIFYGLTAERSLLYQWIDERAKRMFDDGLVEEVNGLLAQGYHENSNSMQGLGYREVIGYLKGEYRIDEALSLLQKNSRNYAKRQLTWFRADKRIQWLAISYPGGGEKFIPEIVLRSV